MTEQMGNAFMPISQEEQARRDAIEKKRIRVENLRTEDNHYEDSVYDLAKVEEKFRKKLADAGVSKDEVNVLADEISDETLGKMEADNARGMDALTGLRARGAYNEELPQLISMEKRAEKDCAILMIDLDRFKAVNDSFGHLVGDEVLKKVAQLIKDSVRASDIVYRYGGEEFVVFLPNTVSSAAQKLAEKIRANIEAQNLETIKDGEKITLHETVSIGVVGTDDLKEWNQYIESRRMDFLEKMVNSADKALYTSKKEGRNRVTSYNAEPEKNINIIKKFITKIITSFFKK